DLRQGDGVDNQHVDLAVAVVVNGGKLGVVGQSVGLESALRGGVVEGEQINVSSRLVQAVLGAVDLDLGIGSADGAAAGGADVAQGALGHDGGVRVHAVHGVLLGSAVLVDDLHAHAEQSAVILAGLQRSHGEGIFSDGGGIINAKSCAVIIEA